MVELIVMAVAVVAFGARLTWVYWRMRAVRQSLRWGSCLQKRGRVWMNDGCPGRVGTGRPSIETGDAL
jgi:hypothetical protein